MGAIHVTVTLRNLRTGDVYESLFLVDTGATDCMAPGSELRASGFPENGRTTYELADGKVQEFSYTVAGIEFMGEMTGGRVIFGPDGTEPILGVTPLDSVGITVDPANRTLRRLPAIPLK